MDRLSSSPWRLLFVLLFAIGTVRAGSTLNFPRLSFEDSRFTGIAIANPTSRQASVSLTAYGSDGRPLSGSGFRNPATIIVGANQQVARTTAELFGTGLSPSTVAWFQGLSGVDGLTGFFLHLNSAVTLFDGADLPPRAKEIIFNEIRYQDGYSTEINLINPATQAASLDITLLGGTIPLSKQLQLAAKGVARFDVKTFFQSTEYPETAFLKVTSTTEVAGFEIIRGRGDILGLNARPASELLNTLYFPQFAVLGNPAYRSEISVTNYSQDAVILTLSAFQADGTLFTQNQVLNNPVTLTLGPLKTTRQDVEKLFGFRGTEVRTGWISVQANTEAINGCLTYSLPALNSLAAVATSPQGNTQALFSHIATTLGYFTGLAILNPGALSANLRVVALKADGTRLGTYTGVLRPRERASKLITELIPGTAGQAGGMIWITCDIPLHLTALFLNASGRVLSNVPPQPVPEAFQPDLGLSRLRVTPPLAVLPPQQVQAFKVEGTAGQPVWSVNGQPGGSAVLGTVTNAGSYKAPSSVPESLPLSVAAATVLEASAASVDVLDKRVLVAQLGLLQSIAYLASTQRLYTAELTASSPAHQGFEPQGSSTLIRDVTSGVPVEIVSYAGEEVSKMIPWEAPNGAGFLLLASRTGGRIIRLDPRSRQSTTVATGLTEPNSLVIDPQTGNLLVAQKDSVVSIPAANLAPAGTGIVLAESETPNRVWTQTLARAATGIAVDRCSGKIYLSVPSQGAILSYDPTTSEWESVATGLNSPGQLLGIYRAGYNCPDSFHILVLERSLGRVLLVVPKDNRVLAWISAPGIQDICFLPEGNPITSGAGVFLAEAPADSGTVSLVETPDLYSALTVNPPLLLARSQGWKETTALPVARLNSLTAAPGNGYVYSINGYTSSSACSFGTADGRVFYAPVQFSGGLGAWQEAPTGPSYFRRSAAGVTQYNGSIYVAGGAVNAPEWDGLVWYAKPLASGSIASWTGAPYSPPGHPNWLGSWPVVAAHNNYLYVGGGRIAFGEFSNRLYYAQLDSNGVPGPWIQTTLPTPSAQGQLVFYNAKAYLLLGLDNCDSCVSDKVYAANVNSNGSLGAWHEARPLPEVARQASMHVVDGHLVVLPGGTSVYHCAIQADGSLGAWVRLDTLPESALVSAQGTYSNGYFYIAGDQNCSASQDRLKKVYFAPIRF